MPPHADIVRELSLRQNSCVYSSTFLLSCTWTDDIPSSNGEYQIMPLPLQGFDQVVAVTQAHVNATIALGWTQNSYVWMWSVLELRS